jgi:hypothetical protein
MNGYFPADGLLGLGYPSISRYQAPPVFQSLYTQGLPEPIFGFYMTQSSNSELFLGGVNEEYYSGSFTYVPVESQVSACEVFPA